MNSESEYFIPLCVHGSITMSNIVLHMLCSFIIIRVYRREEPGSKTQQLFLLNLSLTELMRNTFNFSQFVLILNDDMDAIIFDLSGIIVTICLDLINYSAMILLTLDRLLATILGLRYGIHCTLPRAKISVRCVHGLVSSFFYHRFCLPQIILSKLTVCTVSTTMLYLVYCS